MALEKCKECGNEVSTTAVSCPKCGAKIQRTSMVTKLIAWLIGIIVLISIIANISNSNDEKNRAAVEQSRRASLTLEQRTKEDAQKHAEAEIHAKEEIQKEARFQQTLRVVKTLKEAMKNPDSFQIDQALANDDGTLVCIVYRAQNSFGAITRDAAIYYKEKLSQNPDIFNKHCGGKALYDISYVRQALK